MHDLGLGPPVVSERLPNATHKGPCFDGVYGCHVCHNHANNGRGTVGECEWCHTKDVHTRIVKAWDEPVLYEICAACEKKQNDELERMNDEYRDDVDHYDDYDDYDDEEESVPQLSTEGGE